MTRSQRIQTISALISVTLGIVFGFLPRNWVELRLGFEPDGGDGLIEFLLVAILIAIGLALTIRVLRQCRHSASEQGADSASLLQYRSANSLPGQRAFKPPGFPEVTVTVLR
jgi:hypothetical protein